MSHIVFRSTLSRWRKRIWRSLPALALGLTLMTSLTVSSPTKDDHPSQGEHQRVSPQVNWNS